MAGGLKIKTPRHIAQPRREISITECRALDMNLSVEPGGGHSSGNSCVNLRAACCFETRHETRQQLKTDRAVHAQTEGAIPSKARGTGHVENGIGSTQVRLFDAH